MTNVIPARITSFGTKLFSNTKLVRVTFEDSDASLYLSTAFDSCAELVSVNFGTRQMSIPANAFKNCTSLGSISIGTGVSSLGKNAFSGCTNLTEVNIPTDGALKTVAENVFTNMANLQTVSFTGVGGTLTSIANNAFKGTGITEIEIPEGVTSIGKYAFQNCASLTKISLPASLTSIGENAIDGCDKLSSIDVAADNENFSFNDGAFYVETRVDETKVEVTACNGITEQTAGSVCRSRARYVDFRLCVCGHECFRSPLHERRHEVGKLCVCECGEARKGYAAGQSYGNLRGRVYEQRPERDRYSRKYNGYLCFCFQRLLVSYVRNV